MLDTTDRPTIEELLCTASTTSNMTVSLDRRTTADVVIAAGMLGARHQLGMALIHLRSEWDRTDKPRKATLTEIQARAQAYKDKKGRPDVRRATVEAMTLHARAMRERAAKLSGRSEVIGLLTGWARDNGVDTDLISPALYHWLAPTCLVCNGHGKMRLPDAPSLSAKQCNHCNGTGEWPKTAGAARIAEEIKTAIGRLKKPAIYKLHG